MVPNLSLRVSPLVLVLAATFALAGCKPEDPDTNPDAACGDDVVDDDELCDDGNVVGGDGCSADCLSDETCGNGIVDPLTIEVCDDGDANSDTTADACRTSCVEATCGDGVMDADESCDDAAANSDTTPDACRLNCALPACGDGVTDAEEACDDSNQDDGDGCSATCQPEVPHIVATEVWEVGTQGTGDAQFDNVGDIAVDADGNVYAADFVNDRVQKLDPDGNFLREWSYSNPMDIEVDEVGDVYVWGDWVLRKYDGDGALVGAYKMLNNSTNLNSANHFAVSKVGDEVATVNLYGSVQNLSPMGTIATAAAHEVLLTTKSTADYVGQFGVFGTEPGQLTSPYTAEYDSTGRLFVFDVDLNRIDIFDGGTFVSEAPVVMALETNTGFAIDAQDRMYFRRTGTEVMVYSADGAIASVFAVANVNPTYSISEYLDVWSDPGTGDTFLFTNSAYSIHKYQLEFVYW